MNKNLKIAIFSFLALGLVTATAVSAHQGSTNKDQANNNPVNYEDRAERMQNFHESMSTEDLAKMTQMHELMINGEYEEALEIKDDLDMGQRHGNKGSMPSFADENNNGLCDHMEDIELK